VCKKPSRKSKSKAPALNEAEIFAASAKERVEEAEAKAAVKETEAQFVLEETAAAEWLPQKPQRRPTAPELRTLAPRSPQDRVPYLWASPATDPVEFLLRAAAAIVRYPLWRRTRCGPWSGRAPRRGCTRYGCVSRPLCSPPPQLRQSCTSPAPPSPPQCARARVCA